MTCEKTCDMATRHTRGTHMFGLQPQLESQKIVKLCRVLVRLTADCRPSRAPIRSQKSIVCSTRNAHAKMRPTDESLSSQLPSKAEDRHIWLDSKLAYLSNLVDKNRSKTSKELHFLSSKCRKSTERGEKGVGNREKFPNHIGSREKQLLPLARALELISFSSYLRC